MRYLPHTEVEIRQMLDAIGVESVDRLFDSVPKEAQLGRPLAVMDSLSESELMVHLSELAESNSAAQMLSFLGAGSYAHHIPPAVDQLLLRSEFYTAYTPYQPEVAQGTLQAIWEFQTIASELLGLGLANASMYDGATAAAEGAQMARRLTKRDRVLISGCIPPEYIEVIRTLLAGGAPDALVEVSVGSDGCHDVQAISAALSDQTAAVVVGYPSFFGGLSDLRKLTDLAHAVGALVVSVTTEPYALALAESPGAMGVDIATAEGQALACPPTFGGPGVGLFACRDGRAYLQQLPGRICGETIDKDGQRGFVLTLSTREQHIRRERATSNICTNQGLLALSLTIRTSMLGKQGFIETARLCMSKAYYLRTAIAALPGYGVEFPEVAMFNEFVVRVRGGNAASVVTALQQRKILAGYDLGRVDETQRDRLLVAVTERHSRAQLDHFVLALAELP